MNTIMNIARSLIIMNHWKVERFDIHHYEYEYGIAGYTGYLDIKIENRIERIIIHGDGSFELEKECE